MTQGEVVPLLTSIGTVEGYLEDVIIDGERRFFVRDVLTNHPVRCLFGDQALPRDFVAPFGRRVAVTGIIESRRSGERIILKVNHLFVFPPDETLPALDCMLGALASADLR